jgi:hypothetical protein
MPTKESRSKGGKITGKMYAESGHMNKMIKLSNEARRTPILQYHKNGTFIREWISISDVCRELNLHKANITRVCKGRGKTSGGFVFKYKE